MSTPLPSPPYPLLRKEGGRRLRAGGWSRASQFVCRPRPERVAPPQSAPPTPRRRDVAPWRAALDGATWGAAAAGGTFSNTNSAAPGNWLRNAAAERDPLDVRRGRWKRAPRCPAAWRGVVAPGVGVIEKGSGYLAAYGGAVARRACRGCRRRGAAPGMVTPGVYPLRCLERRSPRGSIVPVGSNSTTPVVSPRSVLP